MTNHPTAPGMCKIHLDQQVSQKARLLHCMQVKVFSATVAHVWHGNICGSSSSPAIVTDRSLCAEPTARDGDGERSRPDTRWIFVRNSGWEKVDDPGVLRIVGLTYLSGLSPQLAV